MRFRVSGFRVWGCKDLGLRIKGFGFTVEDQGFWV